MNRRDFLKLFATAATIAVVAKPLSAVQAVTPPEVLLRPSYLEWLNETEFHSFVWLVARRQAVQNPVITATPGSWAGDELPTIELCLEKTDLPRNRRDRLEVLLELQEKHPWVQRDWDAALSDARRRRDESLMQELMDAYKRESGFLTRVFGPDMFRKDEERRAAAASPVKL